MEQNEKQELIRELKNQVTVLKELQEVASAREQFDKVLEISRQIQGLIGNIRNIESDLPLF